MENGEDELLNTRKEHFNVHLFSRQLSKSILKVIIGLKKDYETRTEKIDLRQYKGVYVPLGTYFNCDPLPQTWLELF